MESTTMTCINCPIGCFLTVSLEDGKVVGVTGNQCKRGVAYAEMESTNPTRMMCTTVRLRGGAVAQLPVKTRSPIPKAMTVACSRALADVELEAPVALGQVVMADICGTGVDVVATRSVAAG